MRGSPSAESRNTGSRTEAPDLGGGDARPAASDRATGTEAPISFREFRHSFSYGEGNDLNFKFLKHMDDLEAAEFLRVLLSRIGLSFDSGNMQPLVEATIEAQIAGYRPRPGRSPAHQYATRPFAAMAVPVAHATVGLVTSSGHFVDGDDPEPLGVADMTQQEAVDRIDEFLRDAPVLSSIPAQTPAERLRVRHGGYDITSASIDPNVCFPADRLREAVEEGVIGGTTGEFYSFPGATAQGRLRRELPAWLAEFTRERVDAYLLVPV